jgi:hypothetical protein
MNASSTGMLLPKRPAKPATFISSETGTEPLPFVPTSVIFEISIVKNDKSRLSSSKFRENRRDSRDGGSNANKTTKAINLDKKQMYNL